MLAVHLQKPRRGFAHGKPATRTGGQSFLGLPPEINCCLSSLLHTISITSTGLIAFLAIRAGLHTGTPVSHLLLDRVKELLTCS